MKNFIACLALIVSLSFSAQAQDEEKKRFDGFHLGADLDYFIGEEGYQNYYLGYRYQFDSGFVLGAEAGLGNYEVDSSFVAPEFEGERVFTGYAGVTAGYSFGPKRRHLIFGNLAYSGANAFRDEFGLSISGRGEQFRIAAGYEFSLAKVLHLRVQVVTVDFGEESISPLFDQGRTNVTLGAAFSF